ncbi:MAG: hypothetical protein GX043_02740 [Desulfovibrionales bacterium]|nr:hypothetical protein [Desulfovibrionales bacterium]
MKPINKPDLACLYFESLNGLTAGHLLPHSRIWGPDEKYLHLVLRSSSDPDFLSAILLASHLIHRSSTPSWAMSWLRQASFAILNKELSDLESMTWCLVFIPVTTGTQARLDPCLIGLGSKISRCAEWNETILDQETCEALELVQKLVQTEAGQTINFLYLAPITKGILVQGQSLGLACYLGAMSAIENSHTTSWLATGCLDKDGRVLEVENMQEKLNIAPNGTTLFLHPQTNTSFTADGVECIAVTHVRQALEVVVCYQLGQALTIAQAEQALQQGQSIAQKICSFSAAMTPWVLRNQERIAQALIDDPQIESLVGLLHRWTDSTQGSAPHLGKAVLDCLTIEAVKGCDLPVRVVWEICMLQRKKANHCGNLDAYNNWKEMAKDLKERIGSLSDGDQELALDSILELIGGMQNYYNFSEPQTGDVQETIEFLKEQYRSRCDRIGPCANFILGQYYGTMGQHYGFCGPAYLDQSIKYLDQAITCFHGNDRAAHEERNRDHLYKVFALCSAGNIEQAEHILGQELKLKSSSIWLVGKMNSYQLHALLRLYVDSGRNMDPHLWNEIRILWRIGDQEHPWQLITYNLGLLAPDLKQAQELFKHSLDLCSSPESGPTIQVMALLPLSRLHALDSQKNRSDHVLRAMRPIEENKVSARHFQSLHDAQDWQDTLQRVTKYRDKLFPYTYR